MTTAPVRHLSIDQFYAEYSDREAERWELVEGIPVRSVSYTHLDVYKRQSTWC